MRALWLVALLLIPSSAQADTETTAVEDSALHRCFDYYQDEGGSLPSARLTGDPQYVYIPGPKGPTDDSESGTGSGSGYGTYVTWGSGCLLGSVEAAESGLAP